MLLAHQAEVVARVLSDVECRYILADEVGLGKTIEACVILKGLMRRNKKLQTLIVAPSSLAQQWHNELNNKFWLDFPIIRTGQKLPAELNNAGYIAVTEDLSEEGELWAALNRVKWGLFIVDEAHHLRKSPAIYKHVCHLSAVSERALILSATPIQRRAREYLKLLALMHPQRYNPEAIEAFQAVLSAQGKIRRKIAACSRSLNPDDFNPEEFEEELEPVVKVLKHDRLLAQLVAHVSAQAESHDRGLKEARDALAYVSENYRIESRVIRNRRAHLHLLLPERALDTSYSYVPDEEETATLDALYDYIDAYAQGVPPSPLALEYCRILMHAAASSPHALLHLLEIRSQQLMATPDISPPAESDSSLITAASPREEAHRLAKVMEIAPSLPQEREIYLEALAWRVKRWMEQTERELEHLSKQRDVLTVPSSHRLGQVLRALDAAVKAGAGKKVIVFSTWPQTLNALLPYLVHRYGSAMIAQFTVLLDMEQLQDEADAFQSSERCRILLCDELGGEPQLSSLLRFCSICGISPLHLFTKRCSVAEPSGTNQITAAVSGQKAKKHYRVFSIEKLKRMLEAEIQSDVYPPPPMSRVAKKLGYDHSFLHKHLPWLCRAISSKFEKYRAEQREEKKRLLLREVRRVTLEVHARGVYPSQVRVRNLLARPGSIRVPEALAMWHATLKELGWEE